MLQVVLQYLFSPVVFLLTFMLPIVVYFVNRRYVWFSIPLTVLVELIINWGNFYYYESRGLMILLTLVQIAVMVILILILNTLALRRKE